MDSQVTAPFKNMTVTVHVTAVSGDPDIFVCNRSANPTQAQPEPEPEPEPEP